MPVKLECVEGPPRGRSVEVSEGHPVPFQVRRHNQVAGQVVVELVNGQCVLTNRSPLPCLINGTDRQRWVLRSGDRVQIGPNHFLVHMDEVDASATQVMRPVSEGGEMTVVAPRSRPRPAASPQPAARRPPPPDPPSIESDTTSPPPGAMVAAAGGHGPGETCSVCDGPYQARGGWSAQDRRICRSCIEKGVRPEHLPNTTTGQPIPRALEDRHAKRISASRLSVVESEERPGGILHRVTTLLGHRADKARLEQLMAQRRELLLEAGRLSMASGGALGVSERVLAALVSGERVSIDAHDVSRSVLDQWHSQRERIIVLDAEIAATRRSLGMGHDPEAVLLPPPPLRPEMHELKERAFATLDGIGTETLSEQEAIDEVPTSGVMTPRTVPIQPPTPPSRNAGAARRSQSRRRR